MSTTQFTHTENTRIRKSLRNGWEGETKVKINGKNWMITTLKRSSGQITTWCKVVNDNGNGVISYMMFGADKSEDFTIEVAPKGTTATEGNIKKYHLEALAVFDAKIEAGEAGGDVYKITVGQILFTDSCGRWDDNRRVVYEVINENSFKTVLLDGSRTQHDDFVKDYKNKFGIGTYYNQGERMEDINEINNLVLTAKENEAKAILQQQADEIAAQEKDRQHKEYLSQFKQADRRATTNILKAHILKEFPQVKKVEVKSDVFSMGSSLDVWYYSPEPVQGVEDLINSLQYGRFNSMEDIYEHNEGDNEVIINGHILTTYKYTTAKHEKIEDEAINLVKAAVETIELQEVEPIDILNIEAGKEDSCLNEELSTLTVSDLLGETREEDNHPKTGIKCTQTPFVLADIKRVEEPAPAAKKSIELVEYNENSFALIGEGTREHKDKIKELGGKFNAYLRCGKGFIFSNKRKKEVLNFLSSLK